MKTVWMAWGSRMAAALAMPGLLMVAGLGAAMPARAAELVVGQVADRDRHGPPVVGEGRKGASSRDRDLVDHGTESGVDRQADRACPPAIAGSPATSVAGFAPWFRCL